MSSAADSFRGNRRGKPMSETGIKKVRDGAVVLGWVSFGLSLLAFFGSLIIVIAVVIPKPSGYHKISDVEVLRLVLFMIGIIPAFLVSPAGGITGIISLVKMRAKNNKSKMWLPITGIVGAVAAFVMAVLAMVSL